ncbi:MAG: hypothetical protein ACI35S_03470 [Anaeroplasma sp.]
MKVNLLLNRENEIIGYRTYPLDLTKPTIDFEDFPKDLIVGEYKYQNNRIVRKQEIKNDISKSSALKYSKEKLLKAFIEYRNNVSYGIITENETVHQEMIQWYKSINNNEINSINNPPKIILKYLEANSWI